MFFCIWLLIFSIYLTFIHVIACISSSLFYCWICWVFHCTDTPHCVYPFTSWWTFGLSPLFWLLGIMLLRTFTYKVYADICFHFSSVYIQLALKQCRGSGHQPPTYTVKGPPVTWLARNLVVLQYPWGICSRTPTDSKPPQCERACINACSQLSAPWTTDHKPKVVQVFSEKSPHRRGPMQSKFVLFRGQRHTEE